MNKEEVNERFKEAVVKFSSYYKYSFSFIGKHDGYDISVSYGGDADDIYRYEVIANENELFDNVNKWDFVLIEKDGEEVYTHDED